MKKALSLVLALAMALSLCACGSKSSSETSKTDSSAESDTVRLAVVGPMTGADAEYGLGFKNSAMIMADKWNANGGVLGKQVEIVVYDDKGSPEEAANVAEQIVARSEERV